MFMLQFDCVFLTHTSQFASCEQQCLKPSLASVVVAPQNDVNMYSHTPDTLPKIS